jgi:hypothetical protein
MSAYRIKLLLDALRAWTIQAHVSNTDFHFDTRRPKASELRSNQNLLAVLADEIKYLKKIEKSMRSSLKSVEEPN